MMKHVLLALAVSSSLQVFAADSNDMKESINKITQLRKSLAASAGASVACETPNSPNCSFQNYCGAFADKAQSMYLFQDVDGRQVPNFQMAMYLDVAEACARRPFPQAAVQDPFVYPEQLISAEKAGGAAQLKKNMARYQEALIRTRTIFEDARKGVIEMLKARRTGNNAAEIDNMIQRIQSAKMATPKLGDAKYSLSVEGCEAPNAFYSPSKHEITICPQFMNMPEASLYATISHELGHAIDPCTMSFGFSKDKDGLAMSVPEFMGGVPASGKEVFKALKASANPYSSVISCLQKKSSIGVEVPSAQEMLSRIDKDEKELLEESRGDNTTELESGSSAGDDLLDATKAQFEDQRNVIRNHYDEFKYCSTFSNNGHMQESFADWVASQTVAKKIDGIQDSAKAKSFAFASNSVFFSIDCENVHQAVVSKIKAAAGAQCSYLDGMEKIIKESGEGHGDHPETSSRVNRIMFAKPEIKKALGCSSSGGDTGDECK